MQNFANFWRARSRLYQNEILQENMRSTAFVKLYKICILLHRCHLKIFANNRFEKSDIPPGPGAGRRGRGRVRGGALDLLPLPARGGRLPGGRRLPERRRGLSGSRAGPPDRRRGWMHFACGENAVFLFLSHVFFSLHLFEFLKPTFRAS